jgi:hypothetical protein
MKQRWLAVPVAVVLALLSRRAGTSALMPAPAI